MIKFILNKQEASEKAKSRKENKNRISGIERFISGNDAKMLPPYTHLGDMEEIFNPLGVSLGASES
jgi:hypothetical protein